MHEHLSRELFRAIHKGWRNPGDLAAIAMAHLFELCPHCRSEFEAWRGELGEGVARDEGDYDGALQKIRERTAVNDLGSEAEEARVERERREARSRAEELLALPDDQRIEWIRSEKNRHAGLLLAEALIEECCRKTPGDPHGGYAHADLARIVLHHAAVTGPALGLFARSLGYLANAVRVIGDLPRAEQILGDARYLLRYESGGDRLARAELDGLLCALLICQRNPDLAIKVALRAAMSSQLAGANRSTVIYWIKLARAHALAEDHESAIDVLETVEQRNEVNDVWLQVAIRWNRGAYLVRLGRNDEGAEWLDEGRELLTGLDDQVSPLRYWLTMHEVHVARGDLEQAENSLQAAYDGFRSRGLIHDQAICDHLMARLLARQGRRLRALERIEEALPVFEKIRVLSRVAELRSLRAQLISI